MDKEIVRLAKLYYADYADEYDLIPVWCELPESTKKQWYDYAERRLNG